jgi:hypothetical protein
MLVQNGPPSRPDPVTPGMRMAIMVLKNWKAEPKNPILILSGSLRRRRHWSEHVMYATDQQVVFVSKMHIEGRSAYIRAIENLFNDN